MVSCGCEEETSVAQGSAYEMARFAAGLKNSIDIFILCYFVNTNICLCRFLFLFFFMWLRLFGFGTLFVCLFVGLLICFVSSL